MFATIGKHLRCLPQPRHAGSELLWRHESADPADGSQFRQQGRPRTAAAATTPTAGAAAHRSGPRPPPRRRPARKHCFTPVSAASCRCRWRSGAAAPAGANASPGSLLSSLLRPAAIGLTSSAHVGANGNCVNCHNGVAAAGKGANHIASNNSCANCHTTNAWLPARFDHQGIAARCASCHNGVAAAGRPISHIPTTLDCSSCHSTIAWRPARFAHTGTVGSCQSCHNVLTGLARPSVTMPTALDCAACHNTLSWIVGRRARVAASGEARCARRTAADSNEVKHAVRLARGRVHAPPHCSACPGRCPVSHRELRRMCDWIPSCCSSSMRRRAKATPISRRNLPAR